jgi:hypothetical protein
LQAPFQTIGLGKLKQQVLHDGPQAGPHGSPHDIELLQSGWQQQPMPANSATRCITNSKRASMAKPLNLGPKERRSAKQFVRLSYRPANPAQSRKSS